MPIRWNVSMPLKPKCDWIDAKTRQQTRLSFHCNETDCKDLTCTETNAKQEFWIFLFFESILFVLFVCLESNNYHRHKYQFKSNQIDSATLVWRLLARATHITLTESNSIRKRLFLVRTRCRIESSRNEGATEWTIVWPIWVDSFRRVISKRYAQTNQTLINTQY